MCPPCLQPCSGPSILSLSPQGDPGQTPTWKASPLLPGSSPVLSPPLLCGTEAYRIWLPWSCPSRPAQPLTLLLGKSHGPFLGHKTLGCTLPPSKPRPAPPPRAALVLTGIWELRPVSPWRQSHGHWSMSLYPVATWEKVPRPEDLRHKHHNVPFAGDTLSPENCFLDLELGCLKGGTQSRKLSQPYGV